MLLGQSEAKYLRLQFFLQSFNLYLPLNPNASLVLDSFV